jgi:hypothetical protein
LIAFVVFEDSHPSIHVFNRRTGQISLVVDGFFTIQWRDENSILLSRAEGDEIVYYEQNVEMGEGIRFIGEPSFVTTRSRYPGAASIDPRTGNIHMARYARAQGKMEVRLNWDKEVLERLPVE